MKVGTDSVILGSWTNLDNVHHILDAGTGTGLLALMVAQRAPDAYVDAVEIDPVAAAQASENVNASTFSDRIRVYEGDFLEFDKEQVFDLIICNPPYFSDSLLPPDSRRGTARHEGNFGAESLFEHGSGMLHPEGRISLVIPAEMESDLSVVAGKYGMFPERILEIYPTPVSIVKRICLEFGRGGQQAVREKLIIEERGRHQYSQAYQELTEPFYLPR